MQMKIIWNNRHALQCNISTNAHMSHSSREEIGIQGGSVSAVYRLQESMELS
jgi:hypothetical protein